MRKKKSIKKDFGKSTSGEFTRDANRLQLEVLLDIRDLIKKLTNFLELYQELLKHERRLQKLERKVEKLRKV